MSQANYVIRMAKSTDLTAIDAIEAKCFLTCDRMNIQCYKRLLKSPSAKIYLLLVNTHVVGTSIILLRKNSSVARLYSFAIDPKFQGKKFAHKLMQTIERKLTKLNISEIRLEVRINNYQAIRFYEKSDFKQFAEINKYYADNATALRFRKFIRREIEKD